jgi:hypothetical protein
MQGMQGIQGIQGVNRGERHDDSIGFRSFVKMQNVSRI